MLRNFSPSQNILINSFDVAQYLITPNVQEVFDAIVNNYSSGLRSINLIGAYGTGKSSFLNALEYHLNEEKLFIEGKDWKKYKRFDILKLVGSYNSIIDSVKLLLNSKKAKPHELLNDLEEIIKGANSKGQGVILMIDEFGKFLEYASVNGAEKELYYLQQIAELINNPAYEAAFITTLHQDFSAYAVNLSNTQRNEWNKVKGRFRELTFNEPVEQLLLLASKRINATIPDKLESCIPDLLDIIANAKAFPLKDYFDEHTAKKIYPLDLLSASILVLALQQYGQNERSLFTFLDTNNFYGLDDFKGKQQNFYSIANVYDYLNYNLYSFLNSKANIHYNKWAEIKNSLERVEGEIEESKHAIYHTIIKTIGLLNIFSHAGAKIEKNFLSHYIELTSKREGVLEAIEDLQKRNLIAYNKHSLRYFYSETTVVDIDDAIQEAGLEISRSKNIVGFLNSYFPLPPISAKKAYYDKGTPRIFEYKITDIPYTASKPIGQVDGFINLVFNEKITSEDVKQASALNEHAVLYAHFLRVEDIQHAIEEVEKAEIAKAKYLNDRIIQRELSSIIDIQKNLLNYYLYEGFFDWESVRWYYRGVEQRFLNSKHLNGFLSEIIEESYPLTPIFISELANKTKLSPAISIARKNLLEAIINNEDKEGLDISRFPPEKSIYLSLLIETGIHISIGENWVLHEITDPANDPCNFKPLFEASNTFVLSTRGAKRSLSELYEILEHSGFKLKRGFLDFWIPIYLLIKREDFALYGQNGFIPEIDTEVLELLVKNPTQYSIKAFDTDGIKIRLFNQYREFLALSEEKQTSNEAFIKTIIPFFKFYKELKPYVKQTKTLKRNTLAVRKALTVATDPEKLFFEDFPNALGYDIIQLNNTPELLKEFSANLQVAIRELRGAYDKLLNEFEAVINSLWNKNYSFIDYKAQLRLRYEFSLKQYLLLPYQKTFYDRLCSPLEDRAAWLSSIAQATIGKTLDNVSDQDVDQLQERFLSLIHELDNLNDIALQQVNLEQEEVFKFELSSPGHSIKQKLIRFPKEQTDRIRSLENEITLLIDGRNHSEKIAILANLLKKELDKDAK